MPSQGTVRHAPAVMVQNRTYPVLNQLPSCRFAVKYYCHAFAVHVVEAVGPAREALQEAPRRSSQSGKSSPAGEWREANRRRQRQTIRYRGLVPNPPPLAQATGKSGKRRSHRVLVLGQGGASTRPRGTERTHVTENLPIPHPKHNCRFPILSKQTWEGRTPKTLRDTFQFSLWMRKNKENPKNRPCWHSPAAVGSLPEGVWHIAIAFNSPNLDQVWHGPHRV